jgi:hypothetical protein
MYYGRCWNCGALVVKDWGGVAAQYHCPYCGIVTNYSGEWKQPSTQSVVIAMNRAWVVVGREEGIYLETFLRLLTVMLGCTPSISLDCLTDGGYEIRNDIIRKVKENGI